MLMLIHAFSPLFAIICRYTPCRLRYDAARLLCHMLQRMHADVVTMLLLLLICADMLMPLRHYATPYITLRAMLPCCHTMFIHAFDTSTLLLMLLLF